MLTSFQSSSKSQADFSTDQVQTQYRELLSIITELRAQNYSIISENKAIHQELQNLRKDFNVVKDRYERKEMKDAASKIASLLFHFGASFGKSCKPRKSHGAYIFDFNL